MMSNRAMQSRHWQRIAEVTGVRSLDVEADDFRLRHVMRFTFTYNIKKILKIFVYAAVKERDIEAKLKTS